MTGFRVKVGGVRMRSRPSTAADIVVEDLGAGTAVTTVTDEVREADGHLWRNVRTSDGQAGWVASDFLGPPADSETFGVTEGGVRLRAEPSATAAIVVENLGRGAVVMTLSSDAVTAGGHTWRNVMTPRGQIGWIASEFLGPIDTGSFTPEQINSVIGSPVANVAANWPLVQSALAAQGMGDRPVQIAAIATIGVESSSFEPVLEIDDGTQYEGNTILGNTEPGDGPRFKGRGYIQITGRFNYTTFGRQLGIDLVGNPDLAMNPDTAGQIFAAFFDQKGIPDLARAGDWREVRRRVNGGFHGLEDFLSHVNGLSAL